uniref:Uncharacterized protein n=1 Tax=Arundo donax TaxID=35708 RepID=A0A0A9BIT1_ARUDO
MDRYLLSCASFRADGFAHLRLFLSDLGVR